MKQKYFAKYHAPLTALPNLTEAQLASFTWLMERGAKELFKEFSPITDYSNKKFELYITDVAFTEPQYDEHYAKENKKNYEAQLKARVKLVNKTLGTEKEQEIFFADFPVQTDHGTFVINGVERVIVPQLIRSFGVLFSSQEHRGKEYFGAKVIPSRGAWVEIETEPNKTLQVRIDRKRKFPVTELLRVLGAGTDDELRALFKGNSDALEYIENTIAGDPVHTVEESFIEIHKKLRDGELATVENAREFVSSIFATERYDLSEVGRFRFNQRFGGPLDKKGLQERTLTLRDIATIVGHIVQLNVTPGSQADDVDDLSSRRVRYVGEMLQQKMRVGLARMKRNIQDRMSIIEADTTLPMAIVNPRPLQAQIKEFYSTNQLSQFMSQENILSEMEHLRTLSALGPGGLSRERAGFEVRDVHVSHYGRLCPIHTPEGPNIGLILHLATNAR
ncbi:MAG TPA: DNA-directed RNA polymerase subunit beta, partial [Candidatus Paceibacterota bacterium]|nr:DNA-directed RNA polymerase subunit beta [Candidatus Paceibacterota bacterium]